MVPTYSDKKMRDEINKEIYKKSFDIFSKKYINNYPYPQIVADKINGLLKFAFEKQFIKYEKGDKPLFTDEITIYTNYDARLCNERLYICIGVHKYSQFYKTNEIIFEAHVSSINKYNEMFDELINNTNNSMSTRRYTIRKFIENTVFRNDKFAIVECDYDDYDSEVDYESEEDE